MWRQTLAGLCSQLGREARDPELRDPQEADSHSRGKLLWHGERRGIGALDLGSGLSSPYTSLCLGKWLDLGFSICISWGDRENQGDCWP